MNVFNQTLLHIPYTLLGNVRKSLNQLLETFKLQFMQDETTIGTTQLTKMQIDRGDSEPVSQMPFQLVSTHHCSTQGQWCKMSSHYRALNKVTWKFVWPMPRVEDIFSKLNSAKYFSTVNLYTGYHHIPLDEDSIPKTAFYISFWKYQYLKVPFGLAPVVLPRTQE